MLVRVVLAILQSGFHLLAFRARGFLLAATLAVFTMPNSSSLGRSRPKGDYGGVGATGGSSARVAVPGSGSSVSRGPSSAARGSSAVGEVEGAEVEATVITKSPSLAEYPLAGVPPRDLGRMLEGQRLGHFEVIECVGGRRV